MIPARRLPKVTFVVEGLVTAIGGAERVLCDVASHLAEAGYEVDIVSHETTRGDPWYPLSDKVRYIPLRPAKDTHSQLRRYVSDPLRNGISGLCHTLRLTRVPGLARLIWTDSQGGFWRRLQRYLAENQRDVAIAFMPRAMVALALARTSYPLVRIASTHTTPQRDFDSNDGDNANIAMRALARQSLEAFDRITVLLPEFQDWFAAPIRARAVVIPNAIAAPTQVRSYEARENLILSVGRLIPVKSHGILIEAWARIAPDFPGWTVEVYGQGPERDGLQQQVDALNLSASFRLMGADKDIGQHYRRAAILAHPSTQEGFAMVVAEALAAGVPAIGFADCPGVNSLIQGGVNGVLVKQTESREQRVAGLASALRQLITDNETREDLAANGPASVARFSPDSIMALWEQMILDAVPATDQTAMRNA